MPPKAGQPNYSRFTMYLREGRGHANIIIGGGTPWPPHHSHNGPDVISGAATECRPYKIGRAEPAVVRLTIVLEA